MLKLVSISALLLAFGGHAYAAQSIGKSEICKAAIAKIMGRSVSTIKVDRSEAGIDYLSYVRDDGTFWSYRCRLEGNQVIWASDTGRWRTDLADGTITYKVEGDRSSVTIMEDYGDGSSSSEVYNVSDF